MDTHPSSAPGHRAPASRSRSATGPLPPLAIEEAFRGLLQHRKLLAKILVISLLTGVCAMFALKKSKHNFEGALLYTPNKVTAPYYTPPALSNLVQVVDSPVLLGKLRDQFDLDDSLVDLKRNLKFELAPGGDTLVVRVARFDPNEAAALLEGAMQLFVEETRGLRKHVLERFVRGFESDLVLGKQAVDQRTAELQSFLAANNLENSDGLKTAATALQRAVTQLDMELEMARIELASGRAKRARLLATQSDQAKQGIELAEGDPHPFGSHIDTDTNRRHFLRDQITEEQRTSSYAVKLKVKQREHERATALHRQKLISDAEMERIDGELSILRAEQNARVARLREQLGHLEQKLARRFVNPEPVDGEVTQVLLGFVDEPRLLQQSIALLELEILGAEHKAERLALKLESKRKELEQVGLWQKEVDPLLEAVRLASSERDRLQYLVEEFRQTQRSEVDELKIVQTATPTIDGVRSNALKILAGTLVGTFGLLVGPVLLREWRAQADRSAVNSAHLLGLPVLANFDDGQDQQEVASLLALRVQRELPAKNSAVLFAEVGSSAQQLSTPIAMAQAAAQRGKSVVLVELVDDALQRLEAEANLAPPRALAHAGAAVDHHSTSPRPQDKTNNHLPQNGATPVENGSSTDGRDELKLGVADFLCGTAFDVDQLIRPSKFPNLGCVSSGTTALTGDLLANGKLDGLFSQLKSDHSLVIVAGPRLDQRLHLECLSSCVDGVVVSCQSAPLEGRARDTVRDLIDAGVPVLGVVA